MRGRILPLTAIIVPFWLVRTMVSWEETVEVLPAIFVVGLSFAGMQYFWSNRVDSNLVDIAAVIFFLVVRGVFLRGWPPKRQWRLFLKARGEPEALLETTGGAQMGR